MYERFSDIERVTKAMNALKSMNEPCYDETCKQIQNELGHAIAYESGYHRDMSRYSTTLFNHEN